MFSKIGKGIKKFVNDRILICKEVFSNNQNRLVLGLVVTGLGLGLIASAYIQAPAN